MNFLQRILGAGLFAILAGCATPVNHATPSGKAEVTIKAVTAKAAKTGVLNQMLNAGYTIKQDSEYTISFDRPVNMMTAVMLGSQYDSIPNSRITYTFAELNGEVRVVSDIAIVTNPGSAFERRTDSNRSEDSLYVQNILNGVKHTLEGPPLVYLGFTTLPVTAELTAKYGSQAVKNGAVVGIIAPNSPASRVDIRTGDIITAMDERPISSPEDVIQRVYTLTEGTETKLTLVRNGKPAEVKIVAAKRPS